mmetsp:Transcript_8964/g.27868  ORF Transcript_8964/g.27868 Transcript_8964/m.27868 type:complete len:128 (-) Transcript_8964:87-470(-)
MACTLRVALFVGLVGLAAAQASERGVDAGSTAELQQKELVKGGLRQGDSKASSLTESLSAGIAGAPYMAVGATPAFAAVVLIPIALIFMMVVAKRMGGFYPFGVVCFAILGLFVYTMAKSPYSYFVE